MNSVIIWVLTVKLAGMYGGTVEIKFPTEQACEQARGRVNMNGYQNNKVLRAECNPRKEK